MSATEFFFRILFAAWIGGCLAAGCAVLFREARRTWQRGDRSLVLFITAGALIAANCAALASG